ncbi:hypothetical protein LSTR_LSTR011914 [Laodelphax striatellus]|uniref:BTB domain-containing protein n=1 Tax=Laodelphax striatellus TaxID=195883 RepID=A0A482WJ68_LAOST|nr:hypothetical protein LSTR_LSTR011914 [Laodelphax striatellus]
MSSNSEKKSIGRKAREEFSFEKRFLRLTSQGMDFDCFFVVGSENSVIGGHKFLFSAASEVFRAMFYGDFKNEEKITIEDLDPGGFEGMKHFIYTGEVDFTSTIHALHTYIAARKYLITHLLEKCKRFITDNLISADVLEFYEICNISKVSEFDELCYKIIQEESDKIVVSDHFLTANRQSIEMFLRSPSLKFTSEMEVFHHFQRWAIAEARRQKYSFDEITSNFNDLKKYIRFLTIDADEFVSKNELSLLLTEEEKKAIAANQRKFGSIPMPEYLSLEREERKIPSNYPFELEFEIDLIDLEYRATYSTPLERSASFPKNLRLKIELRFFYINFSVQQLNTSRSNSYLEIGLLQRIRYKIIVPTLRDGNLEWEGESKLEFKQFDRNRSSVFASIPKKEIEDAVSNERKVTIIFLCDFIRA